MKNFRAEQRVESRERERESSELIGRFLRIINERERTYQLDGTYLGRYVIERCSIGD